MVPAGMGEQEWQELQQGFTGLLGFAYLVGFLLSLAPGRCIVVAEEPGSEQLGSLNPGCSKADLLEEQFSVSLTNTFRGFLVVFSPYLSSLGRKIMQNAFLLAKKTHGALDKLTTHLQLLTRISVLS